MAFALSRNAKLYLSTVESSWDGNGSGQFDFASANTFEVPILDGFSFGQATGTQTITLNESGTSPSRGQKIFNTSLDPVEWSFSTYMRPFTDATNSDQHTAVEKILWNALVAGSLDTNEDGTYGITSDSNGMAVDFESSNVNQLLKLHGYFRFDDTGSPGITYKLKNMCVDSATIDFDIDGIAMINWTGYADSITDVGATYPDTSGTDYVPAPATADFILNRLSTLSMTSDISGSSVTYSFPITGGSFAINNNITYVTPEELGKINSPEDHFTGSRTISGSLTAYLDTSSNETKTLYNDILADINGADPDITNEFAITLAVGGSSSAKKVTLYMAKAHLELPAIDTADVMGVTINFTGLEGTFGSSNNEATITYVGETSV